MLLTLPLEILQRIWRYGSLSDVIGCAITCRAMYRLLEADPAYFERVMLRGFTQAACNPRLDGKCSKMLCYFRAYGHMDRTRNHYHTLSHVYLPCNQCGLPNLRDMDRTVVNNRRQLSRTVLKYLTPNMRTLRQCIMGTHDRHYANDKLQHWADYIRFQCFIRRRHTRFSWLEYKDGW